MPKPRSADRVAVDFQISPWHSKSDKTTHQQGSAARGTSESSAEHPAVVTSMPLHRPSPQKQQPRQQQGHAAAAAAAEGLPQRSSSAAAAPATGAAPAEDSNATAWVAKKRRSEPQAAAAPATASPEDPPVEDHDTAAVPSSPDGQGDEDSTTPEPTTCQGVAQLALTPSGLVSGHFVDPASKACIGISGREVTAPTSGCMLDTDTQVFKLKVTNFQTLEELDAVVSKTGGDMFRMRPAEEWQLRKFLGVCPGEEMEAATAVGVEFEAVQLLGGSQADEQLLRFNPRMHGVGAVVNTGSMAITGMPHGWL